MGRSEMQVRTFQKSRGSKSLPGLVLIFCFHLKQPIGSKYFVYSTSCKLVLLSMSLIFYAKKARTDPIIIDSLMQFQLEAELIAM